MSADEDELLTPKQVAAMFNVTRRTLRTWVRLGKFIQPTRVTAKTIVWRRGDLDEFRRSQAGPKAE